jgi:hypothetical protein
MAMAIALVGQAAKMNDAKDGALDMGRQMRLIRAVRRGIVIVSATNPMQLKKRENARRR